MGSLSYELGSTLARPEMFLLGSLSYTQKQPPEVPAPPATLLKKGLWHRCFPVDFAKFLRTPFFTEHLQTTASVHINILFISLLWYTYYKPSCVVSFLVAWSVHNYLCGFVWLIYISKTM